MVLSIYMIRLLSHRQNFIESQRSIWHWRIQYFATVFECSAVSKPMYSEAITKFIFMNFIPLVHANRGQKTMVKRLFTIQRQHVYVYFWTWAFCLYKICNWYHVQLTPSSIGFRSSKWLNIPRNLNHRLSLRLFAIFAESSPYRAASSGTEYRWQGPPAMLLHSVDRHKR